MVTIVQPPLRAAGAWDYFQTRREVDHILTSMGAPCVLRRSTGDRWVTAFLFRWRPSIQMGGLVDPMERLVLLSTKGLTIPPDNNYDSLVTFIQPLADIPVEDENLRIVAPPARVQPAGVLLYWKMRVRR